MSEDHRVRSDHMILNIAFGIIERETGLKRAKMTLMDNNYQFSKANGLVDEHCSFLGYVDASSRTLSKKFGVFFGLVDPSSENVQTPVEAEWVGEDPYDVASSLMTAFVGFRPFLPAASRVVFDFNAALLNRIDSAERWDTIKLRIDNFITSGQPAVRELSRYIDTKLDSSIRIAFDRDVTNNSIMIGMRKR